MKLALRWNERVAAGGQQDALLLKLFAHSAVNVQLGLGDFVFGTKYVFFAIRNCRFFLADFSLELLLQLCTQLSREHLSDLNLKFAVAKSTLTAVVPCSAVAICHTFY